MSGYLLSPKAVDTLKRIVRGASNNSGTGYSPASVSIGAFPYAYTVQWAQSVAEGSWLIWIPDTSVLTVNGDPVEIDFGDGGAAGAPYPDGWYTLDIEDGDDLYLNITTAEGELTAAFGSEPTAGSVASIKIAHVSGDSTTGAKSVKQYVIGSLVLGSADSAADPAPFDVTYTRNAHGEISAADVEDGAIYFDGALQPVDGISAPNNGSVYLCGDGTWNTQSQTYTWVWELSTSAHTVATFPDKTINIKLYDFSGHVVSMDYRTTALTFYSTVPGDYIDLVSDQADIKGIKLFVAKSSPTMGSIEIDPERIGGGFMRVRNLTINAGGTTTTIKSMLTQDATINIPGGYTPSGGGTPTPLSGNVDFVYDIKYDLVSNQLQKRMGHISAAGAVTLDQGYSMITNGQAVPLSQAQPNGN